MYRLLSSVTGHPLLRIFEVLSVFHCSVLVAARLPVDLKAALCFAVCSTEAQGCCQPGANHTEHRVMPGAGGSLAVGLHQAGLEG